LVVIDLDRNRGSLFGPGVEFIEDTALFIYDLISSQGWEFDVVVFVEG